MKYTIELTDNGCIEELEFNGKVYKRESERTDYGCSSDRDFSEQLEEDGIDDEEILDKVYEMFDETYSPLNFMELAEISGKE